MVGDGVEGMTLDEILAVKFFEGMRSRGCMAAAWNFKFLLSWFGPVLREEGM